MLKKATANLRPSIRKVVEYHYLQERSIEETALVMDISLAATKGRLFHARRALERDLRHLAPSGAKMRCDVPVNDEGALGRQELNAAEKSLGLMADRFASHPIRNAPNLAALWCPADCKGLEKAQYRDVTADC